MIFLGPLISAFILGFLILANLLKDSKLPNRTIFLIIMAVPVGLGACSLAIFWAYAAAASHGKWLSFGLCALLGGYLLFRLLTRKKLSGIAESRLAGLKIKLETATKAQLLLTAASMTLFFYILQQFTRHFISMTCWEVFGGWDARFIWNLKAKFFFRSPSEWMGMFQPELNFSHPDYPLLIPGSIAWGWNWAGKEILIWPALVAFLFTVCTGFLIFWYLLSYVSAWSGFLAYSYFLATGAYQFWSPAQYADIPVCFFMTAATVTLLAAVRDRDNSAHTQKPLFFLAGLLTGMAAWTKNEGLFFSGWIFLILSATLVIHPLPWPDKKKWGTSFATGFLIPFLNILYFKTFLGRTGDFLGSGRTLSEYASLLVESKAKTQLILNGFQVHMTKFEDWNGLWILFFCALVIGVSIKRKELMGSYGWLLAAAAVLIELGYFMVMHASLYEIRFQVETALPRLLLHAGALALIFSFEIFSPSPPKTALRANIAGGGGDGGA